MPKQKPPRPGSTMMVHDSDLEHSKEDDGMNFVDGEDVSIFDATTPIPVKLATTNIYNGSAEYENWHYDLKRAWRGSSWYLLVDPQKI